MSLKEKSTNVCPECGVAGRRVKALTIASLATPELLQRLKSHDEFHYCPTYECDVVWFDLGGKTVAHKCDVSVRVGMKETAEPRPICYCFDHLAADFESEVHDQGFSNIPQEIAKKCKAGLDRCEEMNPQGSCCLGNVSLVVKAAQISYGNRPTETHAFAVIDGDVAGSDNNEEGTMNDPKTSERRSKIAVGGAMLISIVSSACCWLPLLFLAFGFSGGLVAAKFVSLRPILIPVSFALLALGWYFVWQTSRSAADCCETVSPRTKVANNINLSLLTIATLMTVGFAFFPNFLGAMSADEKVSVAVSTEANQRTFVLGIDGMTCAGCELGVAKSLGGVDGISVTSVDYESGSAVVQISDNVGEGEVRKALENIGYSLSDLKEQ